MCHLGHPRYFDRFHMGAHLRWVCGSDIILILSRTAQAGGPEMTHYPTSNMEDLHAGLRLPHVCFYVNTHIVFACIGVEVCDIR